MRTLHPIALLTLAACSGDPRFLPEKTRHTEEPEVATAAPTPAPTPTPTPTPTPVASAPPPPSEAVVGLPKCAPAFRDSVTGPPTGSPLVPHCNAVVRGFAEVRSAIEQGCDGGDPAMCTLLGSLLGPSDWFGADVVAFIPPCHPQDRCWGKYARNGVSPYADAKLEQANSIAALEKGCKAGGNAACEALGVALFMTKDARATEVTLDACKKGRGAACRAIIERNLTAKTTPDSKSLDAIIDTETMTCKAEPVGCVSLATVVEIGWTTEDKAGRTQDVLTRGCDQHDGLSCAKLLFGHTGGKYTLTSSALRAIAPELEKNCEDARALVCAAWGTALKKGLGVAEDATKGEKVYTEACAHRSVDCSELPP
ncbi:MAG: hypothetical protein U0414_17410 [Polyangiaceae bacterium]